jgi:dienelactone hydrolase
VSLSAPKKIAWEKEAFVRTKIVVALLVLALTSGLAFAKTDKETVTLVTDDNKKLECSYYPASAPNSPAVILLPDTRCDKWHFASFPRNLNERGFAVLAMDMRYKDLIARAGGMDQQIKTLQQQDLNVIADSDVKSALDFLSGRDNVDHERVGILGTSLGARIGLLAGTKYPAVRALVLVSLSGTEILPGGQPINALLEAYGSKPILFMSADKDWGGNFRAAEDNKGFYNLARGPKELKIWPGSGHGVEILTRKEVTQFTLSWIEQNLKK